MPYAACSFLLLLFWLLLADLTSSTSISGTFRYFLTVLAGLETGTFRKREFVLSCQSVSVYRVPLTPEKQAELEDRLAKRLITTVPKA
jgi:hypothetical protein